MATATTKTKAPAQKTVTKAPAKKRAARTRTPLKIIRLVAQRNPFDPKRKRHAKWKCLTNGATVSELVAAMKKKGLSSPRTFITNCARMGHLEIK